jgi:hypothetical protein
MIKLFWIIYANIGVTSAKMLIIYNNIGINYVQKSFTVLASAEIF